MNRPVSVVVTSVSIALFVQACEKPVEETTSTEPAGYVGAPACAPCHEQQLELWRGSDHDLAMQEADETTVLGDFHDAAFNHFGVETKFYKSDGKFYVRTDGADGQIQDYEVAYAFGVDPLQQYLIGFPDGRYQALSVAWDARPAEEGGQRQVGRIEADFFEPHTWKPEYPNPAFDRMLPDDAFWAAKIIARFSDEAIRAIVHRGIYLNSESERFLADIIIERRDKVVAHYFRQLNPLDDFRVDGSTLEFRNLGQEHNLAEVQAYEYEWFVFDNQSSKLTSFGQRDESAEPSLRVPDSGADYLMVCIRTRSEDEPNWGKAVEVYLRRDGGQSVVGIERETSLAEGSVGDPER